MLPGRSLASDCEASGGDDDRYPQDAALLERRERLQESVREHAGVLSRNDVEWFLECYYGSAIHERTPNGDPTNACDVDGVAPATSARRSTASPRSKRVPAVAETDRPSLVRALLDAQ